MDASVLAVQMLAPQLWEMVPEDGQWYSVSPPVQSDIGDVDGEGGEVYLSSSRTWKESMEPSVEKFATLVRVFGVEPWCELCPSRNSADFHVHCVSKQHYRTMYGLVQEHGMILAREQCWHEVYVVGGRARYNHLDGEIHLFRDVRAPCWPLATHLRDLPRAGVWQMVELPATVCMVYGGSKAQWPNSWSLKKWKELMRRPCERLHQLLYTHTSPRRRLNLMCPVCKTLELTSQHLFGQTAL